jgi:hypothetical protein
MLTLKVPNGIRDYQQRGADMLTEFDIIWVENIAGRTVTEEEALQFKMDYEDWVASMEEAEDYRRFG